MASSAGTARTSRPAAGCSASDSSSATPMAACSDVPQPVRMDRPGLPARPSDRIGQAAEGILLPKPAHEPLRKRRLGRDHLGHHVRGPGAEAGHLRRHPWIRRAGQWLGRGSAHVGTPERLHDHEPDDDGDRHQLIAARHRHGRIRPRRAQGGRHGAGLPRLAHGGLEDAAAGDEDGRDEDEDRHDQQDGQQHPAGREAEPRVALGPGGASPRPTSAGLETCTGALEWRRRHRPAGAHARRRRCGRRVVSRIQRPTRPDDQRERQRQRGRASAASASGSTGQSVRIGMRTPCSSATWSARS